MILIIITNLQTLDKHSILSPTTYLWLIAKYIIYCYILLIPTYSKWMQTKEKYCIGFLQLTHIIISFSTPFHLHQPFFWASNFAKKSKFNCIFPVYWEKIASFFGKFFTTFGFKFWFGSKFLAFLAFLFVYIRLVPNTK